MKLLLLGDLCPTTDNTAPLFDALRTDELFTDVRTLFDAVDFRFVNLECTLTEREAKINKFGPNLKAPLNTAKVLKELGVDCCGMANNHAFDYGPAGVRDTYKALDEAGIAHTGMGENYEDARKNYIFEKDGQKIAIITVVERNFSYALEDRMGCRAYDDYDTMADIRKAKAECDRVIVMFHGAKENCYYPSPRVRKIYRAMVDNGADVVLSQHTHCIGSYENYNGGHVLHGQGNFHFIWPDRPIGWKTSLATIYDTDTNEIEFIPLECAEKSIHIAKGEAKEAILADFRERCEELHNGKWRDGWRAFCEANRDKYLNTLRNMYDAQPGERPYYVFGHYIDCQAHIDTWMELFPTYDNKDMP